MQKHHTHTLKKKALITLVRVIHKTHIKTDLFSFTYKKGKLRVVRFRFECALILDTNIIPIFKVIFFNFWTTKNYQNELTGQRLCYSTMAVMERENKAFAIKQM